MHCLTTKKSPLAINSKERVQSCIDACNEKNALNVVALDISGLTTIADYFIICSGTSEIQMRAVATAVEDVFDKEKLPCRLEGTGKWLLVDGGDIIIHIFYEDTRKFYELEKLWADAKVL